MKKDILGLFLTVFFIAFFTQEIILHQASPFRGDIPLQFYPWKSYTRSMLANSELPYWNPYTFAGTPFLANMQSAVLYPLDLILFLFPMESFFGLSLFLHLVLAGVGTFLLARKCGASSFPAVLAGLAYGLNGFTMIHIPAGNHLTYAGAAWVPWLLFATVGFAMEKKSRLSWALAGSFITFLHFLCGHPQMTFYSLFFSLMLCWMLGLWIALRIEKQTLVIPTIRTGIWGLFLLLGICMAGFQLIPTMEYLGHANRASILNVEMATEFSFAPHRIITLFFPEYFGTFIAGNHYDSYVYWSCAYAGSFVPILALIHFLPGKRSPIVVPLAVIAFLGLFLAWGRGNPVYTLLLYLPGFGHFRAPAKFLPYYIAAVSVLASLGVERLCSQAYTHQKQNVSSSETAVRIIALFVLVAAILFIGEPRFTNLIDRLRHVKGIQDADIIRMLSMSNGIMLCLSAFTLYLLSRRIPRYPRVAISLSLILLLALDLILFGRGYLEACIQNPTQIRINSSPPKEIVYLRSGKQFSVPERLVTLKEISYPNLFVQWRTLNVAGYDPMSLRSYNKAMARMEGWAEDSFHDNIQLTHYDHEILDMLNVRYVITLQPLEHPQLQFIFEDRNFRVYKRLSPECCWASVAPVKERNLTDGEEWTPADAELEIETYQSHQIAFKYSCEQKKWMRLSEWAYPGWQAEIRSQKGEWKPIRIYSSKEGLRVLQLEPGTEKIRMQYHPPKSGWYLSLLTGILFLSLVSFLFLVRENWFLRILQRLMGRYY